MATLACARVRNTVVCCGVAPPALCEAMRVVWVGGMAGKC